jgi:hypothetical protein
VKRVLLDENVPRKLRRELMECDIRTVQEEGWTSFKNGELLARAQHTFDVLLTADRRLQFQQDVAQFNIGVVVIPDDPSAPSNHYICDRRNSGGRRRSRSAGTSNRGTGLINTLSSIMVLYAQHPVLRPARTTTYRTRRSAPWR